MITIALESDARIEIADTGGGSGVDYVIVYGTNQADDIALNAAGSGALPRRLRPRPRGLRQLVIFRGVERVEVYMLGGADRVLVRRHRGRDGRSTSAAATTRSWSAPCR